MLPPASCFRGFGARSDWAYGLGARRVGDLGAESQDITLERMNLREQVFAVDVFGVFRAGDLEVRWRQEQRAASPALDAMVAEAWARCVRQAKQDGAVLFNGPMARVLRYRVEDARLAIEVGPTDYAQWMGTNYCNWRRGDEFGWDLYSNPLGTTATLITADGWLLYGRRSRKVACHPGYVHTFGGCLEPAERRADGTFDVFEGVRRELNEELAIEPADIADMVCLGLIHDTTVRQPELIFDAHLRLRRPEVEERFGADGPHQEHDAIVALADEPASAVPFLRSAQPIAPIAVGAICLHGRRCFGEAWYRDGVRAITQF